jgi:hypothetical protein
MKKVLSLVLVIAMVLSSFSFAFAAKFEDVEGDYEDAINALVALGVVRGYEDGTFRPENILTRAELAVLLVEALGYGELVAGSTSNFSDTQNHWSNGYVGIAAGTGLVLGYPDGTFKPDQPLTYDEAITMILRAIGYVDSALKGNWPTNFKVKAIDLKLLKDVNMATAAADRGGVAQILYNALELDMMELGEENVLVKAGRLFIDNIATPGTIKVTEDVIDPDHKDYAGDVVDLEPYMFEELDVYFNDDDEVVYIKDSNSTVYEGVVDDVLVRKGVVNVDVEEADESIEKVKFVGYTDVEDFIDVPIYENFVMRTDDEYKQFEDLLDVETIKIVFNENKDGDDDVLTGIVVTQQTGAAQIKNEYKEGRTKIDVFRLPVDDDDDVNLEKVVVKGAVESLEDIEEDDVVVEYAGYNDEEELVKTTLVVSRDTVEGKVTKVSGSKFYIGGVAYEENAFTTGILALGNKGTFFLDHNGDVVAFDGDENEPTDYAIVVGVSDGSVKVDRYGNEAIDEYPQLKLVTQEGEEAYYDIYVDIDFDDVANSAGDVIEKGGEYVELETGVKEYDIVIKEEYAKVDQLIKYSMKDDMIEEMEVVKDLTEEGTYDNEVDLDKSSNKLASNVVIFEVDEARDGKADKYVVIDEDDLTTEFFAYHDRNSSGEITVLVVAYGELAPSKDTFAFIYGVSEALNDDDDEIAFLEVYYAGEDTEFYTTDDFDVDDFEEGTVIIVDLDGDLIDGDSEGIASSVVTASAINYSSELIKIDGKWYSLAENATVVEVEYVDGEYDDASLADFGDIDKETTEFVFYTTTADGNEIGMILILVNYEAK